MNYCLLLNWMIAEKLQDTVVALSKLALRRNPEGTAVGAELPEKISQIPVEKQEALFSILNEYMDITKEPEGLPRRPTDLHHLKKFLARRAMLIKDANYEDLILDGDLIEVYDAMGAQAFRNIEFFNYCSYTVWEVATESWENLYYRSPAITQAIMNEWMGIVKTNGERPVAMSIPKHVLQEIGGEKNQVEVLFKWAWPLFDLAGNVQGTLVIVRAQKLSSGAVTLGFI